MTDRTADLEARVAELERLVLAMADKIYLMSLSLTMWANRRKGPGSE